VRNVFTQCVIYFRTHCVLIAYVFDAVRTVARIFPNQYPVRKTVTTHRVTRSHYSVHSKRHFTQLDKNSYSSLRSTLVCVGHYALSFALLAGYVLRFFAVYSFLIVWYPFGNHAVPHGQPAREFRPCEAGRLVELALRACSYPMSVPHRFSGVGRPVPTGLVPLAYLIYHH